LSQMRNHCIVQENLNEEGLNYADRSRIRECPDR